jgi:hypothetical protein
MAMPFRNSPGDRNSLEGAITLLPYVGRLRYAQAMPAAAKALENDL